MVNSVFCIGELLIDMVCVDNKGLINGEKFEKKAKNNWPVVHSRLYNRNYICVADGVTSYVIRLCRRAGITFATWGGN